MLNMLDTQDKLKNFSEQQLIQEMQRPSGSAPQFMVLGEIERRKRMRADAQRQEGLMQPTVAQEAVSAAGVPQQGIAQVAQSLAPQTDMTQNTGVPNVQAAGLPGQPNQPQRMANGGILRLAPGGGLSGGTLSAIASLKVNRPDIYEEYKDDPEALAAAAEYFNFPALEPEQTGLESVAAPREYDLVKRMFSDPTRGDIIDQQKRDAAEFGADYALDQRAQSLVNQRRAAAFGDDMLFDDPAGPEGKAREYLTGNVSAGRGGSAVPMPGPDQPLTEGLASLAAPERLPDPVISTPSMDVNPRAIDDASDFSSDPRRGEARRPVVPGMGDVLPEASIANATADANRDDLLRYLRGEGPDADLPAVIDNAAGEDGGRFLFPRHLRNPGENLGNAGFLMFGDEAGASPRTDLNRRALAYMQSDMYTPPEQIYDLGPRGRLKYEEAGDEEFTAVSNRLAREAAADARTKEDDFFAAEDARFDAQRAADTAIGRRISRDQPADPDSKTADSLARLYAQAKRVATSPGMTKGDPLTIPAGGIAEIMPPKSEAEKAAEAAALADAVIKDPNAMPKGGTSTAKKGGISDAKRQMDQDKWLALAQAGFVLMSTGDFGKAGQAGIAALRQSKQDEMAERKLEAELTLREAQLAAANRKGSGSALTANQLLSRGNDLIKSGQTMLESAGDNADAVAEARKLITAGKELIRRVTGGVASSGSTSAIKLPSAG
jgi:hypothetical protein